MKNIIPLLVCFIAVFSMQTVSATSKQHKTWLFKNNKDGYNVFRIPAIVKTKSGKLLAFCEGRKNLFDGGNIDLVMKSSNDNGNTWSAIKVIWNDGNNTCGNPSPVVDEQTGNIILLATLNNNKVYVLTSADEGESWKTPIDITNDVKPANWQWYATGPVHAIQMQSKAYPNRIVVPCNHTVKDSGKHITHVIYSDDAIHWKLGGSVPTLQTDESTVAALNNGQLLINMRSNDRKLPNRKVSISSNGGVSWTTAIYDTTLIEPICQGALLRYTPEPSLLLFSNPKHTKRRKNLSLQISNDEGKSWHKQVSIHKGKSAYNDIVVLPNNDVLCIFETGKGLPYAGIAIKVIEASKIK